MNEKDKTLLEVWRLLDNMWCHHQDGSDFDPIPEKFVDKITGQTKYNELIAEKLRIDECHKKHEITSNTANETLLFDIIFNEIQHIIRKALDEENRKQMR